jgi:hypothetical protein
MKPKRIECNKKRRQRNVERGQYIRHAKAGLDKLFNDVVQCLKEKREQKP